MTPEQWNILFIVLSLSFTLGPFLFSWWYGNHYQMKKQKELVEREASFGMDPLSNLKTPPVQLSASGLLTANIMMSVSWWQQFIGGIHSIFGGNITTWDKILSWGRQEVMQRLRETAREAGFDSVINMRMETSEINNSKGKVKVIELLAYGTGIKR